VYVYGYSVCKGKPQNANVRT